jgi:hypothetical protein
MLQLIAISTAAMLFMVSLIAGMLPHDSALVRIFAGLASVAGMGVAGLLMLAAITWGGA